MTSKRQGQQSTLLNLSGVKKSNKTILLPNKRRLRKKSRIKKKMMRRMTMVLSISRRSIFLTRLKQKRTKRKR